MVSTLAFVFRIIRPIIFSAAKNVNFPQSRAFSKVINFRNQRNFPKSWKFSTVMKMFDKQESFPQKKLT